MKYVQKNADECVRERFPLRKIRSAGIVLLGRTLFAAFVQVTPCLGATDGTRGTSSTGDLDITMSVPSLVKISHVADLSFGTYSGSGSTSRNDDVCVWTNLASGNYRVTARGNGAANAFTVKRANPATDTAPYTVRWNNAPGPGTTALTADTISADFSGANTTNTTCSGGVNANFQVSFTQSALLAVPAGEYSGVLTLIISPGTT